MIRRVNVLVVITRREYHGRSHEREASRSLFESTQRKHELCWSREKKLKGVSYDGNLYVTGYKEWFSGCFRDNVPHFLPSGLSEIKSTSTKRVKGTLRYQSSKTRLNDCNGLEVGDYSESVFALVGASLLHYTLHADTWVLKKSVFLSDRCSFANIDYDIDSERFFLKSKHRPRSSDDDIVFYFALFNTPPLHFLGLFALKKCIFGKFDDACIKNGLLALMCNKTFYFYDLEHIINRFLTNTYQIGQKLSHVNRLWDGSEPVVGCSPFGLPENINITTRPPLLYKFSCTQKIRDFSFGGYPWTCLVNYPHNNDFSIHRLSDQKMIAVYHDNDDSVSTIDDKFTFYHFDNSGRILSLESDHFKCFKVGSSFHNDSITTLFNVSFTQMTASSTNQTTRSGRAVRSTKHTGLAELTSPIIHALDYSDELDVIAVLYTDTPDVSPTFVVGFYDSQDGKFIREFTLRERVSDRDDFSWDIYLNEFVVICVQKALSPNSNQKCFIYSLVNKLN